MDKFKKTVEEVKEMPYHAKRDNSVKALKSAIKYLLMDLRVRIEVDLVQLKTVENKLKPSEACRGNVGFC